MANPPPQWPGIDRPFAHKDLGGHLFQVAALYARRALTAASEDLAILDRAVAVGTSLELLAKSALAHISPALLAPDREPKSSLHFSGISTVEPEKAKTRKVGECLSMLRLVHQFDYNVERDIHALDVRNLAAHLGCVDADKLDNALTTMVALSEPIIDMITGVEPSLNRTQYWTNDFLEQVDERLKTEAEARTLKLQQLKAAAFREIETLRARGLEDDMLVELANRPPLAYWEYKGDDVDNVFERHECPVCGFEGWLEYTTYRGAIQFETDEYGDNSPIGYVEVEYEPSEFYCNVCSLRLGVDLLYIEKMGEYYTETSEATEAEMLAAEEAAIERYYEDREELEKYGSDDPDETDQEPDN